MFNPTPTVRGKSNAYLTISPVSQRDEIEILMHFGVFFPRMEKLIDTAMSYLQYEHPWFNALYNTAISQVLLNKTCSALEHKGKGKEQNYSSSFLSSFCIHGKV